MSIDATGRVVRSDSGYDLVIERTYRAPIADVWASIVEPERLDRWIGTYEGGTGVGKRVSFFMTAEGDGPPEQVHIHECVPPTRLRVESMQGGWMMAATLSENDGMTTLVFTQVLTDPASAEDTGPGWEYYLDRLGAALAGAPFAEWDAYYLAQQDHYRRSWQAAVGQD